MSKSNYINQRSGFTPTVCSRYFEQTETTKTSSAHVYFDDDKEELSKSYQVKRDLIFKRLFPSRYADSNNNTTEEEQSINQDENNDVLNSTAQSLGDFIPLRNSHSLTLTRKQSPLVTQTDVNFSKFDESEEDLFIEEQLPTSTHESIIGHLHSRSTIENVRKILIRELYQRTNNPNTEWLKCKMNVPKEYINPKYYAGFQRRYKKDIWNAKVKKKESISTKNNDHVYDVTKIDKTKTTTKNQIDNTSDSDHVIEISFNSSPSSCILLSNDSPDKIKSTPEFIILDTNEDDNNHETNHSQNQDIIESTYFIDRSSSSLTTVSQSTLTSNGDYHKEDSKYAQLPSRNGSSTSVIRPILSKHQRRKQNNSANSKKPIVCAIDRIIDQIDQSHELDDFEINEHQERLIKQIKKRKKKKKKRL